MLGTEATAMTTTSTTTATTTIITKLLKRKKEKKRRSQDSEDSILPSMLLVMIVRLHTVEVTGLLSQNRSSRRRRKAPQVSHWLKMATDPFSGQLVLSGGPERQTSWRKPRPTPGVAIGFKLSYGSR